MRHFLPSLRHFRVFLKVVGAVLLAFGSVSGTALAAGHAGGKGLIAHKVLKPSSGGTVRAPNGAAIFVPPNVLATKSLVTITRLSAGQYDFHINAAWSGRVRITLPRAAKQTYVVHRVGGIWVREGKRGTRSAWVTQLSVFTWMREKLALKACLTRNPLLFLNCLKKKGFSKLTGPLVGWFLETIPNDFNAECKKNLRESAGIEIALRILGDPACAGRAGETPPPPPAPAAPEPAPATPAPTPTSSPAPTPTSSPAPPPAPAPAPPATFNETTGGAARTWTNHTNAGGYEGATISAFATVQIACKLAGFKVSSGNTWWYRIASSPWNHNYYVSADAFYNNGQTSGSLRGTPFVDPAVPDC